MARISNILFVTGTDTGVGKTTVSALLITALRQRGISVGVMKPVETGCARLSTGELIPNDGLRLLKAAGEKQSLEEVVPYRFTTPVSPLDASEVDGREISINVLTSTLHSVASRFSLVIVEGAGGALVPITAKLTFLDLACEWNAKTLIVVGSKLGCLNHALLTFEAHEKREILCLGYVFNDLFAGSQTSDSSIRSNRETLRSLAQTHYEMKELAYLPQFSEAEETDFLQNTAPSRFISTLAESVIADFGLSS